MITSFLIALSLVSQPVDLTPSIQMLRREGFQADFPAIAADADGTPWIAYVEWDGNQDSLQLAKRNNDKLTAVLTIGTPGIIHQPALATSGDGTLIVVWSQVNEQNLMELKSQRVRDGRADGDVVTLASSPHGGNVFARAATDRSGRVWLVWQAMRGKLGDIYCRTFDATSGTWSKEVQVSDDDAGEWEPCVAFDDKDGAWVIYDGSQGNEFNIYANRVSLDGDVGATKTLIATDRYEGRTSAVGTPDGRGIWLTCERGHQQWGLDSRGHDAARGLNGGKDTVLAFWDLTSDKVEEMPAVDGLLADLPGPPGTAPAPRGNNEQAQAKAEARAKERQEEAKKDVAKNEDGNKNKPKSETTKPPANFNRPDPWILGAVNLPRVFLDQAGRPWMTVRYFKNYCWRIALTRFEPATKQWTKPVAIPGSAYGQDCCTSTALATNGSLWLCWPTDLRKSKLHRDCQIQLAQIAVDAAVPLVAPKNHDLARLWPPTLTL